ncbi:MarR family winged helix-turn-helix transcriptional regulator [Falsiphaeobacter marinintestinus]|uniref:MarR family winged helix-turn-helix transcriptional regulator n=1 Tax=Falsiphaeobacter marinintestinus TaxID=1492905 RepID=UPI0011B42C90|nr:MarR family transcriptional regulator [Phaeobacter marinintestinus]
MNGPEAGRSDYILDDQVGFVMRRVNQRHLAIFAQMIPDLTPTQFATLAKLCELGQVTQNALGRATAMDAATIKGVADRLRKKGFVTSFPDPNDQRRMFLTPSPAGRDAFEQLVLEAHNVTRETLAPLTPAEQDTLLSLLNKLT